MYNYNAVRHAIPTKLKRSARFDLVLCSREERTQINHSLRLRRIYLKGGHIYISYNIHIDRAYSVGERNRIDLLLLFKEAYIYFFLSSLISLE